MDPLKKRIYLDFSIPLCAALLEPEAGPEAVREKLGLAKRAPKG